MKAISPWSNGLINLEESPFHVAKMSNSGLHEACCPGVEDLTTRQKSLFQAAKMTKSCSTEAMYFSFKSLTNLEDFHFQVTKRTNRGFVEARYLGVEVRKTWVFAISSRQISIKFFIRSNVPLRSGSHNSIGMEFLGHQNFLIGPPVVT